MRIAIAQLSSVKGAVLKNIERHKEFIHLAITLHADLIIFPELSITGYEPELAKDLAMDKNDTRFNDFQMLSNSDRITIGVGAPIKTREGTTISMVLFQPQKERELYSKQYIHVDEEPFFISGINSTGLIGAQKDIALAICYELSVPQHAEDAFKNGGKIYIASAVKTIAGVEKAITRLAEVATKYSMTVLLANCVGTADGEVCGGRSSVWNNSGECICQLDDVTEGLLVFDTSTGMVSSHIVSHNQPPR